MIGSDVFTTTFSSLPIEIRQKIWGLTLPASRIIRVIPVSLTSKATPAKASTPTYKSLASSWGGIVPQALHINRESRSFAFTHLTECFNCYWNFDIDILYVETPFLGQIDAASKQLYDMRKRGLLDGVKLGLLSNRRISSIQPNSIEYSTVRSNFPRD
jgi:hypothetical protein